MKGTLGIGSVLVLLAILLFTVHTPAVAPPRPDARGTRVAVFNMTHVVKSYRKFERFQKELRSAVDPFQARDQKLRERSEALAKEAVTAAPDRRTEIEDEQKRVQREMEDNKSKASRALAKRQGEQLAELYADVEKATQRLAKERGYDLILHYNDAVTDDDRRSEANLSRKFQAGTLMPIYAGPGVDISADVLTALNDRGRALEARGPAPRADTITGVAP